jgi:pimeloyl-ACP methyl ester carboxylesterase
MKLMQRLAIGLFKQKIKFYASFSKREAARECFKMFCTPENDPLKETPLIYRQAKRAKFMIDGKKIRGHRWNHPKDDRVLILHGFSSAAHKFDKYIVTMMNKGYEVVAFDAIAHGESEGKTINAIEYKEMIKKAIYKFGPFNKYIAHSFGCLALTLALEEVDHDENTRIAFISAATETTSALDYAYKALNLDDKKIRDEIDNVIYEITGNQPEWFSIKRAMPNIKAKILWVHDEDDRVTPYKDVLKVQEKHFPNIEFMITNGLGHQKIYHEKDVKDAITKFL